MYKEKATNKTRKPLQTCSMARTNNCNTGDENNAKNKKNTANGNDFDDYVVEALEIEHDIDSGEYNILASEFGAALLSDEEEDTNDNSSSSVSKGSASATATAAGGARKVHDREAAYGPPVLKADAAKQVLQTEYAQTDGLIRYALVIPDQFYVEGALVPGLNPRDFTIDATTQTATIKTQRPSLVLTMTDLRSSLTLVEERGPPTGTTTAPPRYLFQGCLNGWPSMGHGFELMELEKKRPGLSATGAAAAGGSSSSSSNSTNTNRRRFAQAAQQSLLQAHHTMGAAVGRSSWIANWSPQKHGHFLGFSDPTQLYRAKLRGPDWTSGGWSATSPGFVFWYEKFHPVRGPRVVYGTDLLSQIHDDVCTHVHMISHRYAVGKRESAKDKLTYHSFVFLEWEHCNYGTILEGAFLNGIGGYHGKSNWYDDKTKKDGPTSLYQALPSEMISPWLTTAAELRCYDVDAKNLPELQAYIEKYRGPSQRFLDPEYTHSYPARLSYRKRSDIAQYLVNYIRRDCQYGELTRNCQTFAADLCSFLAGKKDIVPYHPINRIEYHNRAHLFLYDSTMFTSNDDKSLKGKIAK